MSPLLEEAREVHDFAGLSDRLIAEATEYRRVAKLISEIEYPGVS